MLEFNDVHFGYDDSLLLEGFDCTVSAGQKIGLVGRNGIGKTTVFELILRRLDPSDGIVDFPSKWKTAHLRQYVEPSDRTALEFVIDGNHSLRSAERRIKEARKTEDIDALSQALTDYEDAGGYIAESLAGRVLHGLGFKKNDHGKQHKTFSGGWRIRLNLAQTLLTPSDLMLLDEPTNHLDLEATVWLQNWLRRYVGTLICISHDREFLDQTVDGILHIEQKKAFYYRGNYSSFERQKKEKLIRDQFEYDRQEKERQRIQSFVNRFRAKASKAKQVQSRLKMLSKMNKVMPFQPPRPYQIRFNTFDKHDNPLIALDEVDLGYSKSNVLRQVTERIYTRDRIGVLGKNGAGKSTLLKAIAKQLRPQSGSIEFGPSTSPGYFAQHQLELLDADKSPDVILKGSFEISEGDSRNYLGAWGFRNDDIYRPIRHFSGGEKARLVLAILARQRLSVLVLDEPTNHLDIEMRDELIRALNDYRGAVLLVAHDRHLLNECCRKYWLVDGGRVETFTGTLNEYEDLIGEDFEYQSKPKRESRKELRQIRAQLRQSLKNVRHRRNTVETTLNTLSIEHEALTATLSDRQCFVDMSPDEIRENMKRHAKLKQEISRLESEWLEIEERLENSTKQLTQPCDSRSA